MGCGAPTITRRVSDDLLRYPATISQQPAIQSAAMGAVQFARRLAQYAIDASDWRLWTWWLWTWWLWTRWLRIRAGSLWPAIRPIWRSAAHRCLWIQRRMGRATSMGRPAAASALATRRERGGTAIGASPAADPGAGTVAARGIRICRLRPGAAPAEPAGCQRSGEADPAHRAADRGNAAEPAAATICGHARRPRLRSARLGSIWPGSIRAGQSSAEP